MFATTWSGAPSTPSEEIVVFEELEEEEVEQGGKAEHVEEEETIGKHILEDLSKVVEAQTEYDVAVFKRFLWAILSITITTFYFQFQFCETLFQDDHRED